MNSVILYCKLNREGPGSFWVLQLCIRPMVCILKFDPNLAHRRVQVSPSGPGIIRENRWWRPWFSLVPSCHVQWLQCLRTAIRLSYFSTPKLNIIKGSIHVRNCHHGANASSLLENNNEACSACGSYRIYRSPEKARVTTANVPQEISLTFTTYYLYRHLMALSIAHRSNS